jgi:flagellar hook assembly protein FlgD
MDPTEFATQLTELNELQSTMAIQQSVSQIASLLAPSQSSGTTS